MDDKQQERRQEMRRLIHIVFAVLALTACRRELTYDYHPFCDLSMEVDWDGFVETPSGMTAMFYSRSGGEPVTYSTNSIHKTKVSLRTGVYDVVLFNQRPTEFSSISFRGMDRYETAEVYAREIESKTWYSKAPSERVSYAPEAFAVATVEGLQVTDAMLESQRDGKEDLKVFRMIPVTVSNLCRITVKVKGIKNLRSVRGSITGMAEGLVMRTSIANNSEVTHLLESWKSFKDGENPDEGTIICEFRTFGLPGMKMSKAAESWEDALLSISVLLVDNDTILDFEFPIGGNIVLEEGTGEMILNINVDRKGEDESPPVTLPDVKPGGGGSGGFEAEMDSWGPVVGVEVPVK